MSDLGLESKKYYLKMKYQEKQFLRARDFQDEQDYHIAKIKNHNRTLHSRGVCDGLEVAKSSKDYCVDVKPGTAIDFDGNPILLTETETVDLRNFSSGVTNIVLTMRYGESNSPDRQHNLDEGGFTGCTRTMEKPIFEASPASSSSPTSPVDTNPNRLVLAKIVRDDKDFIKSVDYSPLSGRLKAGVRYADVTTADLLPKSVTTEKIADGAVTAEKIAPNTITSFQMGSGSVNAGAIQSDAVTEDKINKRAVTSEKLSVTSTANNTIAAVAAANIRSDAVTTSKIADGAVTSDKLEKLELRRKTKGAVATDNIQTGAVTSAKLEKLSTTAKTAGAVATDNIQDGAVTALKIAYGTVTSAQLQKLNIADKTAGAVATANIQEGAVTSAKLEKRSTTDNTAGAVATDNIQNGAVTAAKIDTGTINFAKLRYDYYEDPISFNGPQCTVNLRYYSHSDSTAWRPSLFSVFVETPNRTVSWTERQIWIASANAYAHQLVVKNESYNVSNSSTFSTSFKIRRYHFYL